MVQFLTKSFSRSMSSDQKALLIESDSAAGPNTGKEMRRIHTFFQLQKGLLFLFLVTIFLLALVAHWSGSTSSQIFIPTNSIIDQDSSETPRNDIGLNGDDEDLLQISQPQPKVVSVKPDEIEEIEEETEDKDEMYRNVSPIWTYRCSPERGCIRHSLLQNETAIQPEICWLTCGEAGALWPKPSKKVKLGSCLTKFSKNEVNLIKVSIPGEEEERNSILQEMWNSFLNRINKLQPKRIKNMSESGKAINVYIFVTENSTKLSLDTDESFTIRITSSSSTDCEIIQHDQVTVQINATTIFGARHALESCSQLIAFDTSQSFFQIVNNVEIDDGPVFPYRGLLLDTARNFIPIPDLKRMIDGMALNKLNIFHWHLTDSNSFPFYSKRVPQMTLYGAYSSEKIYYPNEIQDLVRYALIRGVKIIPELDSPAHAGNGWDWGVTQGLGDLALCVNAEPWNNFCGQPPCGQLNPLNPNTFIVLEKLYQDFMEVFDHDLFHMGGDEVYTQCWESNSNISEWIRKDKNYNYLNLWGWFQEEALVRLKKSNNDQPLKAIVWTSGLTASPKGRQFLNSSSYIIQVWDGSKKLAGDLLREDYQIIMSNIEAAYLDQGAGTWLGQEHIYPYRLWQKFYDNHLPSFMNNFEADLVKQPPSTRQLLGSEATLWSEKVNSQNMDSKTWPRGAALAENLWSNPGSRSGLVYSRLNHHNRRLIIHGIHSDQLQPESCYLISGYCDDRLHPLHS